MYIHVGSFYSWFPWISTLNYCVNYYMCFYLRCSCTCTWKNLIMFKKNSGFVIAILRKIKWSLQKFTFNILFRIIYINTYFTIFIRFFYNHFAAYLARKSDAQWNKKWAPTSYILQAPTYMYLHVQI